ncbi:MAG: zf-HC2 domain-containing protein [Lachnospiraceae bacterium]|nr:zf-HC2 domain-containing protein [Lachnospiraceae bacterium]
MSDKHQECDIVSDLLPLYLEGKTGADSNEFIKNHLEYCPQCKKTLEYMEISYEDILSGVTYTNKISGRKRIKPFQKAKGKIFVCGYLLLLALFWVYMILFLFP